MRGKKSLKNLSMIFLNQEIFPPLETSLRRLSDDKTPLMTKKTSSYKKELRKKTEKGELKNSVSLLRFEYGTRPIEINFSETKSTKVEIAFKPCKHLISFSVSLRPNNEEKFRFAEKQLKSRLCNRSLVSSGVD